MAEAYLGSSDIKVYPTALRGGTDYGSETVYDPESRLGTEFNLTNPVNRLTVDGSFVISHSGSVLEFSIKGYYFKITALGTLTGQFSSSSNIFANIRLKDLAQDNYTLRSLVAYSDGSSTNLDVDGTGFVGCYFSDTKVADNTNTFGLEILRKVSGS